MSTVASCDLEVTIESARFWKEIASYIAMFAQLVTELILVLQLEVLSCGTE